MRRISIYIFCFLSSGIFFAQNAQQDFAKANANLLSKKDLLLEIEYKVYANHFSKTPVEINYGTLKQKGNQIYQRISTLQAIMNDKINLHLDTAEKILVISDPVKIEDQKKEAMQIDTKDILNKCKSVTSKEIGKNIVVYSLEYKEDIITDFDRFDLYYDKSNSFIIKMIFYYNHEMEVEDDAINGKKDTPRMEISYTKIDTNPKFKDSEFDEKLFIQRSGGKIIAAKQFKGFKVIDNRYYTKKNN